MSASSRHSQHLAPIVTTIFPEQLMQPRREKQAGIPMPTRAERHAGVMARRACGKVFDAHRADVM